MEASRQCSRAAKGRKRDRTKPSVARQHVVGLNDLARFWNVLAASTLCGDAGARTPSPGPSAPQAALPRVPSRALVLAGRLTR